jgi:hypothetical protein
VVVEPELPLGELLGLSIFWLLLPLELPLPLVPRSHAATPPTTNADTNTVVNKRCFVIANSPC